MDDAFELLRAIDGMSDEKDTLLIREALVNAYREGARAFQDAAVHLFSDVLMAGVPYKTSAQRVADVIRDMELPEVPK